MGVTGRGWLAERLERVLGQPVSPLLLERALVRWEDRAWSAGTGRRGLNRAVLLCYVSGTKRRQIAKEMGCSLPNVQFLLNRALRDLAICLIAEWKADPWEQTVTRLADEAWR